MDDIDTICANSYRNFHTKGFDYLCLSRTPELTRKVYFFEGDISDLPEVVMPHDHRYAFVTTVLAGAVQNRTFFRSPSVACTQAWCADGKQQPRFDHFEYRTPLNGGDGFRWVGELDLLADVRRGSYTRGQFYYSRPEAIHTLNIRCEGTVLLLEQLADELPLDAPTNAYRPAGDRDPPSLDGLYDRMTPDHARRRLTQFLDLIGNR